MWKADTGTQVTQPLRGHSGWVMCVCFGNKTSSLLASGSWDRTIKIWELGDGAQPALRRTLEGHTDFVRRVALSPDDRYMASASDDYTVGLWDVVTGQRIRVLEGHTACVNSVAWSRDGEYIVSGSWDGTARVWEADVQVCKYVLYTDRPVSRRCSKGFPQGSFCASLHILEGKLISFVYFCVDVHLHLSGCHSLFFSSTCIIHCVYA